jgi:hypothetical protein
VREPITRGEAARRAAAIAALCGLAIVQLAALPYALVQGPQIAAVSGAAIAGALCLAGALRDAGADGGRVAWRRTIALSALVAGGWIATRAVAVPGVAENAGRWTSPVGLAGAGLALGLLVLGVAALGLPRARSILAAVAVAVALAPPAAIVLSALGPAPAHHHDVTAGLPGPHGAHAVASSSRAARFRPGFGGHSGHYVYANATRPHLPAWALALALAAGAVYGSAAAGVLFERARPDPPRGYRHLTRSGRGALYR